jgi:hypothetical protein
MPFHEYQAYYNVHEMPTLYFILSYLDPEITERSLILRISLLLHRRLDLLSVSSIHSVKKNCVRIYTYPCVLHMPAALTLLNTVSQIPC